MDKNKEFNTSQNTQRDGNPTSLLTQPITKVDLCCTCNHHNQYWCAPNRPMLLSKSHDTIVTLTILTKYLTVLLNPCQPNYSIIVLTLHSNFYPKQPYTSLVLPINVCHSHKLPTIYCQPSLKHKPSPSVDNSRISKSLQESCSWESSSLTSIKTFSPFLPG